MSAVLQSEAVRVANDPEAFYALSLTEKWGDGAPLIPPTDERIEKMLAGTPRASPDIVVEEVPPRHGAATVELVAINAVMAGCEPKHLPLVIAALEAMNAPAYNAFSLASTTGSPATYVIVNGPRRDEMDINYRAGCLGSAAGRGSMTVGRALQLCLRNIGGMRAGETSRTVFGNPARFGVCFGEWEERSEWPSLAMRRGFSRDDEVVTVHGGMGTMALCDLNTSDDRELAYLLAKSIASPMGNLYVPLRTHGEAVILINPVWARRFAKTFPMIESFQECMYESCWHPIDFWPETSRQMLRDSDRVDSRGRVHAVTAPDRIQPLVCGGLGNLHSTILPSWGESEMQSRMTLRA
ncbi:MAG TPA: hypothetical protein VNE58_03740 [Casimicrobiaceae bacterium]|nr:hypothetical protein [Casimicrobiaceae bacterium]